MRKLLSREQQRALEIHRKMLPVGLWCHLRNLIREMKEGPPNEVQQKLTEFQQFIQYAPEKMRLELLDELEPENAPPKFQEEEEEYDECHSTNP